MTTLSSLIFLFFYLFIYLFFIFYLFIFLFFFIYLLLFIYFIFFIYLFNEKILHEQNACKQTETKKAAFLCA